MRYVALLLVLVAATASCKRRAPVTRGPEPLTQKYTSKNGLVTARYPASFAGKSLGEGGVLVARNLGGGDDEGVSFMSIEHPITDDLEELSRILMNSELKTMKTMKVLNTTAATCNGNPGIETRATFRGGLANLQEVTRSACVFFRGGHGYSVSWFATTPVASQEEPTLRAVREALLFEK